MMFVTKISELRDHIKQRTNGKCHPQWNWLCVKLLSILAKYPSGISKAIILAEIQQSWNSFGQNHSRLEIGHKRRKVTVDGISASRHIGRACILEAIVNSVQTVTGTQTKIAVLRDDAPFNHTLDMYLHQKLYDESLPQRRLRFTSCRILQGTRNQRLRLLPTENAVILAESSEDLPTNLCCLEELERDVDLTQPHYGTSVRVEVVDLGTEETVHLSNGVTAVKTNINVSDLNGVHASLVFWDEQVQMASLFNVGDTLALGQPFVVPSPTERYTLEYGPASVIHCLSRNQTWEIVQSQVNAQCTPVSVSKDGQGVLDYSAYPERIFIADHRENMTHVTLFCTVVEVGPKELLKQGSKFEIKIQDGTGAESVVIFDHHKSHWDSLYPGQCVVMDGLYSLESKLVLQTQHGGRIWNVSSLPGWLATKFLCSPIPLADASDHSNCVCRAVISSVDTTTGYVRKTHMICGRELKSCSTPSMVCEVCNTSHLTENPNKPGLEKSILHYWQWRFNISVTLYDGHTSIQATLTQQTAQELLQLPPAQLAGHVNRGTHNPILDAMLDTEYLLGLSSFHEKFQVDAVSLLCEV